MDENLPFSLTNVACLLFSLIGLAVVGWFAFKNIVQIEGLTSEADEAERQFEKELLGREPSAPSPTSSVTAAPAAPGAALARQDRQMSGSGEPDAMERLIETLRHLQMITAVEGPVRLGAPPEGKACRLKSGGLCAVLPRLESEAVMAHLARQYDVIFVAREEGDGLVLERLQGWLSRHVELPGEGPPRA